MALIIQVDTREQAYKNQHIVDFLTQNNIQYIRSKLYVGDYANPLCQTVVVDRKKDVVEIAGNICGKQHERFRAECIRAKELGVKLIVLIEEPVQDLDFWKSPKRRNGTLICNVKGSVLKKAMATMTEKYGVEFEFIHKSKSAQRIVEILQGAMK